MKSLERDDEKPKGQANKQRAVFPISKDPFINLRFFLGWYHNAAMRSKKFEMYTIMDHILCYCKSHATIAKSRGDSEEKYPVLPEKIYTAYERYFSRNIVYDPEASDNMNAKTSCVLSIYCLTPISRGVKEVGADPEPGVIKVNGFVDSTGQDRPYLGQVEWSMLVNSVEAKIKPLANLAEAYLEEQIREKAEFGGMDEYEYTMPLEPDEVTLTDGGYEE